MALKRIEFLPDTTVHSGMNIWLKFSQALPWLVLAVSLFVTFRLWVVDRNDAKQALQAAFDSRTRETLGDLEQRMETYQQILLGTQGLFAASFSVEREEFRNYVVTQHLDENFPGIQGVGFSRIVPRAEKDQQIAVNRKNTLRPSASANTALYERDINTSIVYLEPFSGRNLRAMGFDMYAEPVRRIAMQQARDTGKANISGKVTLVQETGQDVQSGFLMYLPVYKNGTSHDTLFERRNNIHGWVYAPFRMRDLMAGLLDEHITELNLKIYDGDEIADKTLLFDSAYNSDNGHAAQFVSTKRLDIAGRTWTVVISALPAFESQRGTQNQYWVVITGTGISLMLLLITWLLVQSREHAILAATKMNSELIVSEERAKRIGLLYKMLSDMNSANIHIRQRDKLFDEACRIIMESGLFRMVWIGLLDQETGVVIPVSQAGHIEGYLDNLIINIRDNVTGIGPTGTAVRTGVPVVCDDIVNDPRMEFWREKALKRDYRASATFPLMQSGQSIGALSLYSSKIGVMSEDIIQMLKGMSADISLSLDFIAEIQSREKAQEELQDLSTFLQEALESERSHIARELHDELGQSMTALRFDLKWLSENIKATDKFSHEKLLSMNELVGQTVDSIRRISEDLRPGMLDDLGLAAAIENHVAKFSEQSGIACDLSMSHAEFDLDDQVATALFRIIQEALTNVARHSGASHVVIRLQKLEGKMLLIIQDNGRGLPLIQQTQKKTYGLLGMRERIKMLGGTLDIFNEKDTGVRIEACVLNHLKESS